MIIRVGLCTLLIGALAAIHAAPPALPKGKSFKGSVVSVSPPATQVGASILRQGGNAVDAAIAMEFALAVTWPEAGNIGGGGFMMVHPADGRDPVCIDYRETAPRAATRTMFQPEDGRYTHKIVGVPGTVHGMATAHKQYGSLPWKTLVMPAVNLAREGFEIDASLAGSINQALQRDGLDERHDELKRVYGKPGNAPGKPTPWTAGDRLVLPDLADTLVHIANKGASGFYKGPVARALVEEMKRGNGLIRQRDLSRYRAKVRPPVKGTFRGYDVYGPPPPSSGGICLVLMLHMLEPMNLSAHGRYSPRTLHLMTETMKRAFRDRAVHLGDTDFIAPTPKLVTRDYARALAGTIATNRATPSEALSLEIPVTDESPQTTHFSVVDRNGMAVANTTTLEGSWGAHIVVRGAGYVLNNEMGDFNWFPGHTDRIGRIGTTPNQIEPGKRMLSSQTPVIVATNGRPVLVTGSPGGRTIINTSLQMVLNVLEFGMTLPEAMQAPRLHHSWFPDVLYLESYDARIGEETVTALEAMGHRVSLRDRRSYQGDAHSIWIDPSTHEHRAVPDWRRNTLGVGPN